MIPIFRTAMPVDAESDVVPRFPSNIAKNGAYEKHIFITKANKRYAPIMIDIAREKSAPKNRNKKM